MVRRIPLVFAAFFLALSLSAAALAQEASPVASPVASRDSSLLTALGLPEINLVATDADVTGLAADLDAGRYLVTLENQTANQEVELFFNQLPEGTSVEQATADLNSDEDTFPAWAYEAVWAGGPNAYAGQTDAVVITLVAGDWWVAFDRTVDEGEGAQPESTVATLTVTGDLPAMTDPDGLVDVGMTEYSFEVPEGLVAGPQLWALSGTGEQPHFLVLWTVPDGTTFNQVMGTINAFGSGTPEPDAVAFEDIGDVYDSSILSNGQTEIIQLDLEAGTYAAVCFVPDAETGAPHAFMGMVTTFTVS